MKLSYILSTILASLQFIGGLKPGDAEALTSWIHDQPSESYLLKHWHTGKQLTIWRGVHPFLLAVWISSRVTHDLKGCSPILISGSNLLKHWRLTLWMDVHPFLSVVPMGSNTGEGLTPWMGVHPFSSVVQICSNTKEGLTSGMGVHPFLSVVLICSNTGEGLTSWMDVHPFLSVA